MTDVTIPGGAGNFTITVTANAASNLALDFAVAVANDPNMTDIGNVTGTGDASAAGALVIVGDNGDDASSFTPLAAGQYTYAGNLFPLEINGSSAGRDTVLGGGSGAITYDAAGDSNRVIFSDGDSTYNGVSSGRDVIAGGDGSDTVNAGTGSDNTVFAGAGNTLINLNNAQGSDVAVLMAGDSTVNALGASDVVYASAALAATAGTISGGSGVLDFVAGASSTIMRLTIEGGAGTTDMFGNNGSCITFQNTSGTAAYIAGGGNETLNGAGAEAGFAVFGDTVAGDASSINQTLIGGQGADFFSTGGGNETIFSRGGGGLFHINDLGPSTHITIVSLASNDWINFAGLKVQQEQALLKNDSHVSDGSLFVTLAHGTQVEFLNVTSFDGNLT